MHYAAEVVTYSDLSSFEQDCVFFSGFLLSVMFSLTSAIFSMTSLLTHTVAHSTRPSFRPKTNNQPIKKFLSLAVS